MPTSKSKSATYRPVMNAPIPAPFPSGGYISPTHTEPDASDDADETSDSPFFSNAEMELHAPVFDRDVEEAYQADEHTAGFPGPFAYQTIVYEYLKGLSSKKREKALLNVTMYSAVMYVLNNPKDTGFKTAQFRFWAKKMFCLTEYEGDWVLTHDGKPVACREQMHGVLKHCHAIAGHGGRDKTSAEVRKFYSWIPKEIVARFVQMCPSCKSKRTMSSAALGVMTGPQTFFCNLQNTEQKLAQGKAISLAQARAHVQSAVYARKHAAPAIGQGRVHNVGSSSYPPQNAINYGVPQYIPYPQDGQFGQPDFFQPQHQHIPPGALPRSVSYDQGAPSREYYAQVHDTRRVSAPVYPTHIAYSPRAAMWNAQHMQRQAVAAPTYMPMPSQEADFDSLGDVRQACGSSAKQSPEEQPAYDPHSYADHSQIDPQLAEYPYNPHATHEYYPVHDGQYDNMAGGSGPAQHFAPVPVHSGDPTATTTVTFDDFVGDHDSPLSVNEFEFADVPNEPTIVHDDSFPDGLDEALHQFTNHDMLAYA